MKYALVRKQFIYDKEKMNEVMDSIVEGGDGDKYLIIPVDMDLYKKEQE